MTSNPKKVPLMGWDLCALAVLLVPAAFLYIWKSLRTSFIYAAFGDFIDFPVFTPDPTWLIEHLASPGGPTKYVSDFLSQFFYFDSAGALILTALAAAFYIATLALLRAAANVRSHVLAAVPAIAAIALYGDYNHRLPILLALFVSVALAAAFISFRPQNAALALAVFMAIFALAYWAAAAASFLFAVLVALTELLRRRWLTASADCGLAAAAYLIGTYGFLLEMPRPFTAGVPIFPLNETLRAPGFAHLFLLFPAAVLLAAAASKARAMFQTGNRNPASSRPIRRHKKKEVARKPHRTIPAPLLACLKTGAAAAVIAAAAILAVRRTHDPNRKHALLMNALLRQRQWQAYIDAATTFYRRGFWSLQVNHDVNRALYHSGRLLDDMFAFQQNGAALMLITAEHMSFASKYLRVVDLFFDLGNLNDAEHWAYEVLESEGPSPLILQRLADINLAENQPAAASVLLHALRKDLVHGPRAEGCLLALNSDATAELDPRIENACAMNWRTPKVLNHDSPEHLLLDLLDQNPKNRMAFEYLMALYLLMHDQEKVVANLHRLDALGYDRIPGHLEEAILIHMSKTRKPVELPGRQVSPQTQQRFQRFMQIRTSFKNNRQAAAAALAPEYAGSYFFYSMFADLGVGR